MQIVVNRMEFLKRMRVVEKAIIENKIRPIISCVYIETRDNELLFCGSNLETTISTKMICDEIVIPGKIVFQHQLIDEYIKELKDEFITLKLEDSLLKIESGDSETEFSVLDPEDYPKLLDNMPANREKPNFTMDSTELSDIFEKIKFSAGGIDNIPINCVRVTGKNNILHFVTTDSYRLTFFQHHLDNQNSANLHQNISEISDTANADAPNSLDSSESDINNSDSNNETEISLNNNPENNENNQSNEDNLNNENNENNENNLNIKEVKNDENSLINQDKQDLNNFDYNNETFNYEDFGVSIPIETVESVNKILKSTEKNKLNFYLLNNNVHFELDDILIISRIISLPFPEYELILGNTEYNKKLTITSENILNILKRVMVFVKNNNESKHAAILSFENDELSIVGVSDIARINEKGKVIYSGESIKISLNIKSIIEFISNIPKPNEVEFELYSSNSSVRIKQKGNDNYIYILMPLALRN